MVAVEVINVAIRDEDGQITGYLGINRDITERKRDEEALREANVRIASLLESSTDDFIAFDQYWGYTYVH
jgi:PAS domain-containing protein